MRVILESFQKLPRSMTLFLFVQACILPYFVSAKSCLGETIATLDQGREFKARGCTTIAGTLAIKCDVVKSDITDLKFMESVRTINGKLIIEGCQDLKSLDGLQIPSKDYSLNQFCFCKNLKTISGDNDLDAALQIRGNDDITHIKQLEQIESVKIGGVLISGNKKLCWANLMVFPIRSGQSNIKIESTNCAGKQCHHTCKYCGGPGPCFGINAKEEKKEDDSWIWIPISISIVVFVIVIIYFYYACKHGHAKCECHCSKNSHVHPAIDDQTKKPIPLPPGVEPGPRESIRDQAAMFKIRNDLEHGTAKRAETTEIQQAESKKRLKQKLGPRRPGAPAGFEISEPGTRSKPQGPLPPI